MSLNSEYLSLLSEFNRLKNNARYRTYAIIAGAIIIILLLVGGCNRIAGLKNDLKISEQNEKALSDTVRYERNKVGDLEASKNILVSKKKDLEDLNADLANELSKEKGKVRQLNKYIAEYCPDTVYVPVEVFTEVPVTDSTPGIFRLEFDYDTIYDDNNKRRLQVENRFSVDTSFNVKALGGQINIDKIQFSLVTGLREKDGNIEIFARSGLPNLNITHMDGAIIDPKKHPVIKKFTKPKKFGVSAIIGGGLIGNGNMLGGGFFIGAGLTYDLIQF